MSSIVLKVLAGFGALVLILVMARIAVGAVRRLRRRKIRQGTVLEIDFSRGISEGEPEMPGLLRGRRRTMRLMDLVFALEKAAEDRRIGAVIADLSNCRLGMGTAEEIRDAILLVRKAGKRTIAFTESFSGGGEGMIQYFLASAFDEIWLQSSGSLGLAGFRAEAMFLREAFQRAGIEPEIGRRHEYKSAAEMFLRDGMSPEAKSSTESILAGMLDVFARGVAEGLGIAEARVRELLSDGPFLAEEALAHGLVTALGYRDQAYAAAATPAPAEEKPFLYIDRYLARAGHPYGRRGTVIAVIHGVGTISHGPGALPSRRPVMRSDRVAKALRAAVRDRSVKGILFRVDSPGGSYVASDTIAREVMRARDAGKPVVVSMGNVAASGGYFVSMYADRIFAREATLTGSIGVFGGKFAARKLWERFGIHWDGVSTHDNAGYWSSVHPYSEKGLARRERELDAIYADFTGKAASARGLDPERMDRLARGRVWTGARAAIERLVDARGGYREALAALRELTGLPEGKRVRLRSFPKRKGMLERWRSRPPENSFDPEASQQLAVADEAMAAASELAMNLATDFAASTRDEKTLFDPRIPGFFD